jgi:hypothetical protein
MAGRTWLASLEYEVNSGKADSAVRCSRVRDAIKRNAARGLGEQFSENDLAI